jgi:hypothetical protein
MHARIRGVFSARLSRKLGDSGSMDSEEGRLFVTSLGFSFAAHRSQNWILNLRDENAPQIHRRVLILAVSAKLANQSKQR